MNISKNGLALIKKFEGCRLTSYQDSVGVWTIGYGTTSADKFITGTAITKGMTITQEKADSWLEKSVNNKYAPKVAEYNSTYNWNQNQFDALVSFAYNIGSIDGLVNNGKRTIAQISEKILEYNKAGGKVLAGLTNRRKAEKELFDTAVKATDSAPAYTVGKTYTLQSELKVRKGAGTTYAAKKYSELTSGGKASDKDKDGCLDKGTKVTCQEVKKVGGDIWIRCPSGWLAAYYQGNTYIK